MKQAMDTWESKNSDSLNSKLQRVMQKNYTAVPKNAEGKPVGSTVKAKAGIDYWLGGMYKK